MGTLLDRWLEGLESMPVVDDASISQVRQEIRRRGPLVGLQTEAVESLAAAASELAHNQLAHAACGYIALREVDRGGVPGLELIAADRGSGMADPAAALRGQPRASGSLGIGVSAARRLSDEMDIDVRGGEGTCVRLRRFASPVTRSEVAILARPCQGETICGDDALAIATSSGLLLAVADGLGHGSPARTASSAAMDVIRASPALEPAALLAACGPPLRDTRGAVATIAVLDRAHRTLSIAGAGNVTAVVHAPGRTQRALGNPHILGSALRTPRFDEQRFAFDAHHPAILFSDGIASRADLSDEPDTLRKAPIEVAQRLLERFGRPDDDALVLVAR